MEAIFQPIYETNHTNELNEKEDPEALDKKRKEHTLHRRAQSFLNQSMKH